MPFYAAQIPAYLFRFAPLAAGCALGARFEPTTACALAAAAATVSSAVGALLLHTAPLARITWRNVVACWLMPWSHLAGGGSLGRLAFAAFVTWLLLALAGVFGHAQPWLLAGWLLDGVALWLLAKPAWRASPDPLHRRAAARVSVLILALAGAGLVAHLLGFTAAGVVIAGGPVAVIGVVYGLFVSAFLVARPTRF